jgi:SNF2 family DNA or RNA helicase
VKGRTLKIVGGSVSVSGFSQYTSVLALILRLRQACDHPYLALSRADTDATSSALSRHLAGACNAHSAAVLKKLRTMQAPRPAPPLARW